jgi:glyoxylase-like metal-dependent hydrolase (beta-lactamase superfamily II)
MTPSNVLYLHERATMPLEDDFCDIVKKARLGQALSVQSIARAAGLPVEALSSLEGGTRGPTSEEAESIANALSLRPQPLVDIGLGRWTPAKTVSLEGIDVVLGDIGGYEVKGYVLHDSGEAVLIDTGYNAAAMLDALRQRALRLTAICLTHGHADHADGLEELLAHRSVPVYLGSADERLLSWRPPASTLKSPADGDGLRVGRLTVRFITTPGHTPGGICYRVDGGGDPVCFVGDTLFAGSIGRSNPSNLYPAHLESVHHRVLTLPGSTVLLPGHGPGTTVVQELAHNPFAARTAAL